MKKEELKLHVTEEVKAFVRAEAKKQGKTMNAYVTDLILSAQEKKK